MQGLSTVVPILIGLLAAVKAAPVATNQDGHWVNTWSAMPQLTEYNNLPLPPFNGSNVVFQDATIRQTLHMSIGAPQIRLRISNAFGVSPLPITAITIAQPVGGANGSTGVSSIDTATLKTVTFSGNDSITIPNAALAVSDPIDFAIEPQSEIAVSIYLASGQTTNYITSHPGSRTTSWYSNGNEVNAANLTITDPSVQSSAHWFFVSAVEAWSPPSSSSFGILGDSITDGRGSDTNGNNRWPDLLLANMQADPVTSNIGVFNQAAGGNRILADGLGPNTVGRLDRDILAQSGVKYAMIFEGVNDIGTQSPDPEAQRVIGDQLIQAFNQIITRVHTAGIPIFGTTITPFGCTNATLQPYSNPERERTRARVNDWILHSGRFDYALDFASVVANPDDISQLDLRYSSGDCLHPNVAGYKAIADYFPLEIFEQFAGGVGGYSRVRGGRHFDRAGSIYACHS